VAAFDRLLWGHNTDETGPVAPTKGVHRVHDEPVPLEYSIGWFTCTVADMTGAVVVGLLDAAQDRPPADVPGARPGRPGIDAEVVNRNSDARGFQVVKRRWVVERSLGWLRGRADRWGGVWLAITKPFPPVPKL
jgi:transposase